MITLDYADKRPIYEQIKDKLRELIIKGVLDSHDRIPSVRELAMSLAINPNTIQKAYRELETEGYIYSQKAKGYFVVPREDTESRNSARTEELFGELMKNITELKFLGVEQKEILERVIEHYNKENE